MIKSKDILKIILIIFSGVVLSSNLELAEANLINESDKHPCVPDELIFHPQWRTIKCQTCRFTVGKPPVSAAVQTCSTS